MSDSSALLDIILKSSMVRRLAKSFRRILPSVVRTSGGSSWEISRTGSTVSSVFQKKDETYEKKLLMLVQSFIWKVKMVSLDNFVIALNIEATSHRPRYETNITGDLNGSTSYVDIQTGVMNSLITIIKYSYDPNMVEYSPLAFINPPVGISNYEPGDIIISVAGTRHYFVFKANNNLNVYINGSLYTSSSTYPVIIPSPHYYKITSSSYGNLIIEDIAGHKITLQESVPTCSCDDNTYIRSEDSDGVVTYKSDKFTSYGVTIMPDPVPNPLLASAFVSGQRGLFFNEGISLDSASLIQYIWKSKSFSEIQRRDIMSFINATYDIFKSSVVSVINNKLYNSIITYDGITISIQVNEADALPPVIEGPTGPIGATGARGDSSYETWVANGNPGTYADYIESLKGPQGPVGPTGAGLIWRGQWVTANYVTNDIVSYEGSSYICKATTINNEIPTNTTYWDPISMKGDDPTFIVSNAGSSGVGVFHQTISDTYEFRNITSGSTKVDVSLDAKDIKIDITPTQISIGDLSGAPSGAVVGDTDVQVITGKTIDSTSNTICADKLRVTDGSSVDISGSSVPTQGQILTATNASTASWQTQSIPYYWISSDTNISTTSYNYNLVSEMEITPNAGTYYVSFSASTICKSSDKEMNIGVFMNGTLVPNSERREEVEGKSGQNWNSFHTQCIAVVNGSQSIEIKWKGHNYEMGARSLFLQKLA